MAEYTTPTHALDGIVSMRLAFQDALARSLSEYQRAPSAAAFDEMQRALAQLIRAREVHEEFLAAFAGKKGDY